MRKTSIVSLMILLGLSQTGAAQAANTALSSKGLQLYQNGQYLSAYDQFTRLAKVDVNNPEIHYLLAITMVKLNDPNHAIKEYQRTISLDPRGTYGRQAQIGLQALTASTAGAPTGYAGANGNIATVADAMSAIRQEAHFAKQAKRTDAQADVNAINESTTATASKLAMQRNQEVADMENSYYTTRDGCTVPMYTQSDIDNVAASYNNRISSVQDQGAAGAAQALANGQQTVNALRDSAHNLYAQLSDTSGSGVKLIPQGTNLYVRNYASN
jgi:tetratricopeptide (TPR) repeat protein